MPLSTPSPTLVHLCPPRCHRSSFIHSSCFTHVSTQFKSDARLLRQRALVGMVHQPALEVTSHVISLSVLNSANILTKFSACVPVFDIRHHVENGMTSWRYQHRVGLILHNVDIHDGCECRLTTMMHVKTHMVMATYIMVVGAIIWLPPHVGLLATSQSCWTVLGKACTLYKL